MYTGQIINKLNPMGFEKVYTVVEELIKRDAESLEFRKYQTRNSYFNDLNYLISISKDKRTKQYFEIIKKSIQVGNPIKDIMNLCSDESQYFLR